MATRQGSQADIEAMAALAKKDPRVQQILNMPGQSDWYKRSKVNDYLFGDPNSPLFGKNQQTGVNTGGRGTGFYQFDPASGSINWHEANTNLTAKDYAMLAGVAAGPIVGRIAQGATAAGGAAGGAVAPTAAPVASSVAPAVNWAAAPSAGGLFAPSASAVAPTVSGTVGGLTTAGTHLGLSAPELWKVGAGGAQTILGLLQSRSQTNAANRASELQARGISDQLAFERENEARRREEYDRAEVAAKAQWDAEQARRAPARAAAAAILSAYTGQGAPAARPMPANWRPMTSPTTAAQTIGQLASASMPPTPTTAPLAAPSVTYNPQARTVNDLLTRNSFLDPSRFGGTMDPRMRY